MVQNWTQVRSGKVRSGVGTYAGAARRRVHLATVFGLRLAIAQADTRPVMFISLR